MRKTRLLAVLVASLAAASLASQSEAQSDKFPFDAALTKPLGYRVRPGLDTPHVLPHPNNYLQPPARLKIVGASGPLWQANTYCQAEYQGHTGWLRCDDKSAFSIAASAPPAQTVGTTSPAPAAGEIAYKGRNGYGLSCVTSSATAMADCYDYCTKACDPVPANNAPGAWKGWNCPHIQKSGDGLMAENASNLKNVRSELPNVTEVDIPSDARATPEVVAGLRRLDEWVRASATPAERAKYKIRVSNCWRDGGKESEKECGFVVRKVNPQEKGLAWPGANPHSAGNACDIVIVDAQSRQAMFGFKVEPKEATAEVRAASRYLDKAITAAGGKRLGYETWHYEWGGAAKGGRCVFGGNGELSDCDKFWPPQGHP